MATPRALGPSQSVNSTGKTVVAVLSRHGLPLTRLEARRVWPTTLLAIGEGIRHRRPNHVENALDNSAIRSRLRGEVLKGGDFCRSWGCSDGRAGGWRLNGDLVGFDGNLHGIKPIATNIDVLQHFEILVPFKRDRPALPPRCESGREFDRVLPARIVRHDCPLHVARGIHLLLYNERFVVNIWCDAATGLPECRGTHAQRRNHKSNEVDQRHSRPEREQIRSHQQVPFCTKKNSGVGFHRESSGHNRFPLAARQFGTTIIERRNESAP